MAPAVMAAVEALPSHGGEQQNLSTPAQHHSQAIPTLLAPPVPTPPSQPTAVLSALPVAMAVTPPVPASMANASPTQPAASSTATLSSALSEVKIKQETEPTDTSQPGKLSCSQTNKQFATCNDIDRVFVMYSNLCCWAKIYYTVVANVLSLVYSAPDSILDRSNSSALLPVCTLPTWRPPARGLPKEKTTQTTACHLH